MAKGNTHTNDKKSSDLYVVGVGASAGGLDALSRFLSMFNSNTAEFCVVIVMHLSPDHKSELTSILTRRCKWPVKTIEQNVKMEARTIYVTPNNCDLHVEGDLLKLDILEADHHHSPSVDGFFNSLATSKGRLAIGVILSGFGKDGSLGIKAIKRNKGFTIAQLPDTAEYNSMPSSAISTNCIDAILPIEQMFEEIKLYCRHSQIISANPYNKESIDAIFELLENRTGTDFSLYKPSTIMRRINRRMDYLQLPSIQKYHELIKEDPNELDLFFNTVLIGVTEFFRDKSAFENLKEHLETLIESKKHGEPIRIWSVGCATGEEPYSILILLHEILDEEFNNYHIQIFASDIDERALNFGRKGIYSKQNVANLKSGLLEKYFDKKSESTYEIKKELKQNILFTKHDITNNPPFVKLDLIVCRNLLIYFNNILQKQTFQIFHYALRPKGLLFLGKSENVSVAAELFQLIGKSKIFKKLESNLAYQLKFSRFGHNQTKNKDRRQKGTRTMSIVDVAKETLYHNHENPFLVIDANAEIKEVNGGLRLYLEVSQGTMNTNLFKMVNKELVLVIKSLFSQVKKTGVQHSSHVVKFNLYNTFHYVKIRIIPLIYTISDMQYFMVVFEKVIFGDKTEEIQKKLETMNFADLRIRELEEELSSTKEHLQVFAEELEATNEELQTINEELQSSNEELKSSNEELETSNEEMQSANEELNLTNNELRISNENLIKKENELLKEKAISIENMILYKSIAENIPNGTVGILNANFEIQYLSGKGLDDLDLNPINLVGKNFIDLIPSKEERSKLTLNLEKTLKGEFGNIEFTYENRYFDLCTVPLNINDDSENKIMYLSQDITEKKKRELKLGMTIDASGIIIYEWNAKNNLFEDNPKLNILLEYDAKKPLTEKLFMDKVHSEDRDTIVASSNEALETGILNYEARLMLSSGIKHIRVLGKILYDDNKEPEKVLATIIDVTEDKNLLYQLQQSEERFRTIADSAPVIIWMSDAFKKVIYLNKYWYRFTGTSSKTQIGDGWLESIHPDDKEMVYKVFSDNVDAESDFKLEFRLKAKDGNYRWFLGHGKPILNENEKVTKYIGSCSDIQEHKELSNELKESNEQLIRANINLEEYAYVASHDLQEPIRKIRTFNSIIKENLSDKEMMDYAAKIEQSGANMTSLIKNILDYSRLSPTRMDVTKIDLHKLIDRIKFDLELVIEETNTKIVNGDLGEVVGNESQLYQLFGNIIKNGITFNSNDPLIKINREIIKGEKLKDAPNVERKKTYTLIEISDNGIGIEKKHKHLIFKPFKTLNSKSNYPGSGIGLAICKKIVDFHGGLIEVESKIRQGTTFKIYLPLD